ncbi:MAG TPA: hypothetical protein PKJ83_17760, partial [Cyclobacteriaceae bacterium]|nr:hypothetical protein [Cyclobacteriaceae bacterium]
GFMLNIQPNLKFRIKDEGWLPLVFAGRLTRNVRQLKDSLVLGWLKEDWKAWHRLSPRTMHK